MCNKKTFLAVFLLILVMSASVLYADQEIYLYSGDITGEIDIDRFVSSGEIMFLTGTANKQYIVPGPAPEPYPELHVWETGIEQIGPSGMEIDGMVFINHGTHWVAGRRALVEWKIDIPQAAARLANEFEQNLTITLWVDWNRDQQWAQNEQMILQHFNLHEFFPTTDGMIHVTYLTSFRVPDVDDLLSSARKGDKDRDVYNLWVRGVLSYDDASVSPDQEQLFGDGEDYMVRYMKTPRPREN